MKKILLSALSLILVSGSALAQGQIAFDNVLGSVWTSPSGSNLDSSYSVQLFAAPEGTAVSALSPIGAVATFLGGAGSGTGWFSDGTRVVNSVIPGAVAAVVVRAWRGAASYAIASTTPGAQIGESNLLNITTGGASIGGLPPTGPAALTGLNGVQLTIVPVPEPSVILLSVIGCGALMLRRRKA